MTEFGSFDNSTCKRVLDLLEPGDLTLGQVVIKRVAVVEQRQRWRSKESPRSLCKTSNNRLPCVVISCELARRGVRRGAAETSDCGRVQRVYFRRRKWTDGPTSILDRGQFFLVFSYSAVGHYRSGVRRSVGNNSGG